MADRMAVKKAVLMADGMVATMVVMKAVWMVVLRAATSGQRMVGYLVNSKVELKVAEKERR